MNPSYTLIHLRASPPVGVDILAFEIQKEPLSPSSFSVNARSIPTSNAHNRKRVLLKFFIRGQQIRGRCYQAFECLTQAKPFKLDAISQNRCRLCVETILANISKFLILIYNILYRLIFIVLFLRYFRRSSRGRSSTIISLNRGSLFFLTTSL